MLSGFYYKYFSCDESSAHYVSRRLLLKELTRCNDAVIEKSLIEQIKSDQEAITRMIETSFKVLTAVLAAPELVKMATYYIPADEFPISCDPRRFDVWAYLTSDACSIHVHLGPRRNSTGESNDA